MNYYNKHILTAIILLIVTIAFFQLTDLDLWVENLFYNFQTHKWLVDENNKLLDFMFYSGIKKLLIVFALSFLIALVVVGGLKKYSNTPCPKNLKIYGGVYPDIKVLTPYPKNSPLKCKHIRCWPAGHASGGFALLSLFFLFKSKKNRKLALILALSIGWAMGLYKMLIGDHFLSHTIVTMLLAYLIVFLIAKILFKGQKSF